jgi:predicted methyltransferase MtxX (methanogen marker protein 4)
MEAKIFDQKIEELVKLGKVKIAFGLKEPNEEILASLERGKQYADIILVGPEAIKDIEGFEKIIIDNPEEKIAEMLVSGEVEGIIRGTIDDFRTVDAYQKLTGQKRGLNPGIMEDAKGRQFFLTPASNPEAWDKEARLERAEGIGEFMRQWGIEPKIAVFCGRRHETYPRKKDLREGVEGILNKTYEDADWIVQKLLEKGYDAKNWSIDLNPAVEAGCNLLLVVNGMVGNQIFRAFLVSGGKMIAVPVLGMAHCYEDNSRTERDFESHVKWLAAWINSKK